MEAVILLSVFCQVLGECYSMKGTGKVLTFISNVCRHNGVTHLKGGVGCFATLSPFRFYNAISKLLRQRHSQALAKVDEPRLRRTWEEFEYRVDISRVTNGTHIEHLYLKCMSFHVVFKLFRIGIAVLAPVVMKSSILWDIMPCSPLKVNRRFGGTYRLRRQGRNVG
jgi:hypothetical protein